MKNLLYIMILGCVSTVVHAKWVEVKPSDGKVPSTFPYLYVFDKNNIYATRYGERKDVLYKWNKGRWQSLRIDIPEEIEILIGNAEYSLLPDGSLYVLGYNQAKEAVIYKWDKKWTKAVSLGKDQSEKDRIKGFFAVDHNDFLIIRNTEDLFPLLFRGDGKQWRQIEMGDIWLSPAMVTADKRVWFDGHSRKLNKEYIIALDHRGELQRIKPPVAISGVFGVQNMKHIWLIGDHDHHVYHFNGKTGAFTLKNSLKGFVHISVGKDGTVWGLVKKEGSDDLFNNYVVEWQE